MIKEIFELQNPWRTTNQTEIDFIVTKESGTEAIEVKWNKMKPPKSFQTIKKYYPEMVIKVISREHFLAVHETHENTRKK